MDHPFFWVSSKKVSEELPNLKVLLKISKSYIPSYGAIRKITIYSNNVTSLVVVVMAGH